MKKKRKNVVKLMRGPRGERADASPSAPAERVRVGDIVVREPEAFAVGWDSKTARGRVIWIHPLGRFHVVEFGEGTRAFRECFHGVVR